MVRLEGYGSHPPGVSTTSSALAPAVIRTRMASDRLGPGERTRPLESIETPVGYGFGSDAPMLRLPPTRTQWPARWWIAGSMDKVTVTANTPSLPPPLSRRWRPRHNTPRRGLQRQAPCPPAPRQLDGPTRTNLPIRVRAALTKVVTGLDDTMKGSQLLRWVPRHCTGVIVPPRRGVHYPCTCKQTTSTRRQGGPRTAGARAPLRRVLGSCAARRACC